MEKNIFQLAIQYFKDRLNVQPSKNVPSWDNSQAMSYYFNFPEEALAALTVLTEMLNEHNLEYVRLEIMMTPYKNIVTLEDGDEEWDYDEEDYDEEE